MFRDSIPVNSELHILTNNILGSYQMRKYLASAGTETICLKFLPQHLVKSWDIFKILLTHSLLS